MKILPFFQPPTCTFSLIQLRVSRRSYLPQAFLKLFFFSWTSPYATHFPAPNQQSNNTELPHCKMPNRSQRWQIFKSHASLILETCAARISSANIFQELSGKIIFIATSLLIFGKKKSNLETTMTYTRILEPLWRGKRNKRRNILQRCQPPFSLSFVRVSADHKFCQHILLGANEWIGRNRNEVKIQLSWIL